MFVFKLHFTLIRSYSHQSAFVLYAHYWLPLHPKSQFLKTQVAVSQWVITGERDEFICPDKMRKVIRPLFHASQHSEEYTYVSPNMKSCYFLPAVSESFSNNNVQQVKRSCPRLCYCEREKVGRKRETVTALKWPTGCRLLVDSDWVVLAAPQSASLRLVLPPRQLAYRPVFSSQLSVPGTWAINW